MYTRAPVEIVSEEASQQGLQATVLLSRRSRTSRRILISGRRCQVIPARLLRSPSYPQSKSINVYLPRTQWPDFLIYVAYEDTSPTFYVVPRMNLSADT